MKKILFLSFLVMGSLNASYAKDIILSNATIKLVPKVSKNTAGFIRIENKMNEDIVLIKVESDIAKVVELHDMGMKDGMMVMRTLKEINIPKKGTTELKSGEKHIMFINLNSPLEDGQKVNVKLIFNNGLTETHQFEVKSNTEAHTHHSH